MTASIVRPLSVPYADTRADQLALVIDGPELPYLARQDLAVAGIVVSMRLLGASHQIVVEGSRTLSETVACLPEANAALPSDLTRDGFQFRSEITAPDGPTFAALVDDLIRRADRANGSCLIGRFPREPHAVTAIFADVSTTVAVWETWHTYPQDTQIVHTRSEFRIAS
ncbi:Protein of unknown function DUF2617 [Gordonia malaquae]|uniref:DUF2617 domain-containing protein n=1 Tax=Gordonia malaquae NBRC 108250 TaxID=1223542 RepID=M3UXM0_GORML|nr:DUF2617 family protein [Gordonia malaquae]GAC80512.1 hypothetical protein GM1_018_00750 [Gordonia malaquae NBRC 108250]SEE17221.1 Protein of unknown function DUF2617 [Gordonia malaquae]